MKHLRNIRRNLIKASKQGHASIGLRIQKKIQKKRVLCHQANAVWWLLMVLGNPAPTEMVSVLAETLRTCSSPTPLTTCTVRLPPPVQPSFLTLTSILVRVKLDKKKVSSNVSFPFLLGNHIQYYGEMFNLTHENFSSRDLSFVTGIN